MNPETHLFKCLYYPFSRLLDEATLKYLLLVFDSIAFIDDVDPDWRSFQLKQMSKENPTFAAHESLRRYYDSLVEERIIQIVNARELKVTQSIEVAQATVADLSDPIFLEIASSPTRYGLPARPLGAYGLAPAARPTWQIFYGKLVRPLVESDEYLQNATWSNHILIPGTDRHHWTLTYEAGSSAALNFYLGAAEELRLTPITTSTLHHNLVLRKLKRIFLNDKSEIAVIDDYERRRLGTVLSQGEIIRLFLHLFPLPQLQEVSFEEIIKFREDSRNLRREFVQEVDSAIRMIDSSPTSADYDIQVAKTMEKMKEKFVELNNELAGIRDKVFPSFLKAFSVGVAGGSALGAGVTFLGGLTPSGLLAASALPVASSFLVNALDLWAKKRALLRKQTSAVTYLARISDLVKR